MINDEMVMVSAADLRIVLNQRTSHAHSRPGIWDADNRPGLANSRCMDCDARDRLIAALRSIQPAASVPEERSDEKPKYATGGVVEPGHLVILQESDGCFIPASAQRSAEGAPINEEQT